MVQKGYFYKDGNYIIRLGKEVRRILRQILGPVKNINGARVLRPNYEICNYCHKQQMGLEKGESPFMEI